MATEGSPGVAALDTGKLSGSVFMTRIMGKQGRNYSIWEIRRILGEYKIRPRKCGSKYDKSELLHQLQDLEKEKKLTVYYRRRISLHSIGECTVCLERVGVWDPDKTVHGYITSACKHVAMVCLPCISRHIDTAIEDGRWNSITCPECPEALSFDDVKEFASKKTFQRYDDLVTKHLLSGEGEFRNCLGPYCNAGQYHQTGDAQPIMTCNRCGFRMCFTHQVPWVEGETCEDHERKAEEDRLSKAFLETQTKTCPGTGCGLHVVKVSGCDHMTCHHCRHEFCWLCMKPYADIFRRGNAAHEQTCPYHPRNLPRHPEDRMVHPIHRPIRPLIGAAI